MEKTAGTATGDDCSWSITHTYIIKDTCGNRISDGANDFSITYTGGDDDAPTIDTTGSDLILACDDGDGNAATIVAWLLNNGGADASDNCGGVKWSNDFTTLDDDCGAGGSVTVTFTATDDCGNDTSFTQDILVASINIVKTFTDDEVIAGGDGSSFTLVVTNDGTAPLSNILIADDVDVRLTVTGVAVTIPTAEGGETCDPASQNVSCRIPTLAVGETATIKVNFEVDSAVEEANGVGDLNDEDNVPNDATVDAVATNDNTISVDDDSSDSIDILVDIDLDIVKTFDPTEVPQGTLQSFTIDITNNGPSDAVDVAVTDFVDTSLNVQSVTVSSGSGDCSASSGQDVDCTVQIPTGESATITVQYLTAPFFDNSGSPYNTGIGDDFYFVFVNGSVLEGSTDGDGVFLDGVDITANVSIITSLTRNDIVFDPPGNDPAFELHLSCSDPFTGGWGQSGGPVQGIDDNWQIAYFSIGRYSPQGFLKSCGNVTNPFDIVNTADTSGEDSFGTETATDDATVTIGPGITLDRLQTKGKRLTARLNNLTGDDKIIDDISIVWPGSNGSLTKVWLTQYNSSNTIWQGDHLPNEATLSNCLILDENPCSDADPGWNGGTLLMGEAILRFDFNQRVDNYGYIIRVHFMDGTWLDINVQDATSQQPRLMEETTMSIYPNPTRTNFNVRLDGYNEEYADIVIYDMSGRQVQNVKKQYDPNKDLLVELPPDIDQGVYFIKLKNKNSVKAVRLIISSKD